MFAFACTTPPLLIQILPEVSMVREVPYTCFYGFQLRLRAHLLRMCARRRLFGRASRLRLARVHCRCIRRGRTCIPGRSRGRDSRVKALVRNTTFVALPFRFELACAVDRARADRTAAFRECRQSECAAVVPRARVLWCQRTATTAHAAAVHSRGTAQLHCPDHTTLNVAIAVRAALRWIHPRFALRTV